MTQISSHSTLAPRNRALEGMKPLFKEGQTTTIQDSVFFRPSDDVKRDDWACHLDRFKSIDDKNHPDYMNRVQGFLAAGAATAAGVATSLVTAPYSLTLVGPIIGGTTEWASGDGEQGLFSTIGKHLTLPAIGASKVADTVFEKVAETFYEGNGPTLSYYEDQDGKIWGVPKD
jgi:hypothetical protein